MSQRMSQFVQTIQDPHRERLEANLAAHIAELFGRCPMLCGFTVREGANADHGVLDLTCYPTPSRERADLIFGEVTKMLLELEEEQPEAAPLLKGRTFARTFH